MLDKQGHETVIAENGARAVEAVATRRFDLVLMDVQMPVMGGLEATIEIRRREASRGGRVPIIGLTAHAMKGDKERCIEAGMDAYLTKPIKAADLNAAIRKLSEDSAPTTPRAAEAGFEAVFDREAALENVGGDEELLSEIAELWLSEGLRQLDELRSGLGAKDAAAIEQAAHSLRGSLATLGAARAAAAAGRVERAAADGELSEISEPFADFEHEVARVQPHFRRIATSRAA